MVLTIFLLSVSSHVYWSPLHRTHSKVPPQQLFLGSSMGTPSCVPRVWLLMLLKHWNSHFSHCQSHVCFHPWRLAELLLPQCVLWKELLYLAEWLLFHNTQPQVHGSVPVPCLWPWALMVSFLHEVQRCASQANSDLLAWLSSPSARLWYAYIRLASVTPRPFPFPQGPFSYLPHSLWRCSAHIKLTQQF